MMKRILVLGLLLLLATSAWAAGEREAAPTDAYDQWMQRAQVGIYQPEVEDWDAIYEAAKQEGKVVIYSSTSRIFDGVATFEEKFPGIEVEAYNISGVEILEKIEREAEAGIRNADVVMTSSVNPLAYDLIERQVIFNYVPRDLVPLIPEQFREPLLTHRYGSVVMYFSDVAYTDGPPISSIWELTKPEWKDRIVIRDPLRSAGSMNWMASWVVHADVMAANYEEVFGRPIELTTPNAGYELIKRLLDNGLQLRSGSRDVLDAITQHDQPGGPPVGQGTSSNLRDVLSGRYQFEVLWDLEPFAGYAYENSIPMMAFAPHPNAAKLLITHLVGGLPEEDPIGFAPWHVPGNFPVRTDIETPHPFQPITEYNYLYEGEDIFDVIPDVMDFWLTHM